MNKVLSKLLLTATMLLGLQSFAQLSDREKLTEAIYLMDEKRFTVALPILQDMHIRVIGTQTRVLTKSINTLESLLSSNSEP